MNSSTSHSKVYKKLRMQWLNHQMFPTLWAVKC